MEFRRKDLIERLIKMRVEVIVILVETEKREIREEAFPRERTEIDLKIETGIGLVIEIEGKTFS